MWSTTWTRPSPNFERWRTIASADIADEFVHVPWARVITLTWDWPLSRLEQTPWPKVAICEALVLDAMLHWLLEGS